MKKTSFKVFASLALAVLLASCSGLKKMKNGASDVKYTVTPEVLEAHAGKVDVTIDVKVPEKYMKKKVILNVTPVLKYKTGETAYASKTVQGEGADGNNQVISYKAGGQYSYKGSVPYVKGMKVSDLVVRVKATEGKKTVNFDDFKIAEGVIATAELVKNDNASAAIGKDKFHRVIKESKKADVYFLIQQASLRGTELKKDEVKALKSFIKDSKAADNIAIKGVKISAYASPDGAYALNTHLAERRQKVSASYMKKELKRSKVNASEDGFVSTKTTPEDWAGFKKLMQKSSIQDKSLILRVLSMYSDPEVREKEIKNVATAYKAIAKEVLPQLRRSQISANIEITGKSDDEIKNLAASKPSKLNAEELLYAATLSNDLDGKLAIYKKATDVYPNEWRAYNNVACILIKQGKYDAAQTALNKANSLKANNPVVKNNLGVIALHNGNLAKAKEYFGSAAGAGSELNENLGIVAIHEGNYGVAINHFGNSTSSNAALAKILAGKYEDALSTLNANTEETGFKYYLKAIVGARTANKSLLFKSLRKSVKLDSSLKADAAKDKEFSKYAEDATFKSIVK